MEKTQYVRVEFERRFLVARDANWHKDIEPYSKRFEDKYLSGTRLRLRVLTNSDSDERLIKLTKKELSPSPYFQTIGRILLSPEEYEIVSRLDGHSLTKVRHYLRLPGRVFSIDVFEGELAGLVLCETEAENLEELMAVEPPPFVQSEVTEDMFFTGGNLCRLKRADLNEKLGANI